jgi:hypothetical protein
MPILSSTTASVAQDIMQTIERELSVELSASHRDSEEDFRTLFGESTDSNKPIPSLTWVENELAAMDMGNPSQAFCDAQEEYHPDELLLRDISIPGPSEQGWTIYHGLYSS